MKTALWLISLLALAFAAPPASAQLGATIGPTAPNPDANVGSSQLAGVRRGEFPTFPQIPPWPVPSAPEKGKRAAPARPDPAIAPQPAPEPVRANGALSLAAWERRAIESAIEKHYLNGAGEADAYAFGTSQSNLEIIRFNEVSVLNSAPGTITVRAAYEVSGPAGFGNYRLVRGFKLRKEPGPEYTVIDATRAQPAPQTARADDDLSLSAWERRAIESAIEEHYLNGAGEADAYAFGTSQSNLEIIRFNDVSVLGNASGTLAVRAAYEVSGPAGFGNYRLVRKFKLRKEPGPVFTVIEMTRGG